MSSSLGASPAQTLCTDACPLSHTCIMYVAMAHALHHTTKHDTTMVHGLWPSVLTAVEHARKYSGVTRQSPGVKDREIRNNGSMDGQVQCNGLFGVFFFHWHHGAHRLVSRVCTRQLELFSYRIYIPNVLYQRGLPFLEQLRLVNIIGSNLIN